MYYLDSTWADAFTQNQMGSFESIWQLQLPSIDAGNVGRGGKSWVSRHIITMPDGKQETIYIKRQQNYTCSSWRAPLSGVPTFEREFLNWKLFRELGIPSYELLYYAERRQGRDRQAILISKALPAMDLLTYLDNPHQGFKERRDVIRNVACTIKKMHDAHIRHGHLSPIHVFVGGMPGPVKVYLIDMEVARKVLRKRAATLKDLGRLAKHTRNSSLALKMRFFLDYLGQPRLSPQSKHLWRELSKIANPA
jgi:hypothetical protein